MRLGTQVVDFCGFGGVDDVNQAVAIDQVPVMQNHLPLKYFFDFTPIASHRLIFSPLYEPLGRRKGGQFCRC